jgi:hypothetical protein
MKSLSMEKLSPVATLPVILFFIFIFCSRPASAWTVSCDFEKGTVGTRAQGPSGFSYAGSATLFSDERSARGKKSAKLIWTAGSDGWDINEGFPSLPSPVKDGQEIWARGYFYFASPWSFIANPQVKGIRIRIGTATNGPVGWNSIEAGGVLKGDLNNVNANKLGYILASNEPISRMASTGAMFDIDKWQSLEIYTKLSTTTPVMRIWKNGILIYENKTDKTILSTTDVATTVAFMSYWNGGAPQNQTEYIDEVVVTTDTPSQRDSAGNPMIGTLLSAVSLAGSGK